MTRYWHYTTGDCLAAIMSDGFIRPATSGIQAHEKPINWFSAAPNWEPTATKGVIGQDGTRRDATLTEMRESCGGLFRLSVDAVLTPWPMLGARAGIGLPTRRALETVARRAGAEPAEWAGTLQAIPVADILGIEQLDASGEWRCL